MSASAWCGQPRTPPLWDGSPKSSSELRGRPERHGGLEQAVGTSVRMPCAVTGEPCGVFSRDGQRHTLVGNAPSPGDWTVAVSGTWAHFLCWRDLPPTGTPRRLDLRAQ